MSFNQKAPEWKNSGTEPSESLKNSGFVGGYKPPASVFNWFWYRVSACLQELQKMKPSDIGAAAEKHSANHSEDGSDPIAPYNIGAVDAMIGVVNGSAFTFDTALKQGEYNVQAVDAAGAPYAGSLYGKLIVTVSDGKEKTDSNWIWQEYLPASASKQRCWRMKINTGDWTDWFVPYHTGNKPTLGELGAAAENHKHPHTIAIGYDRTDIASGADLNNILDMGCYRCSTATKAATLLNSPTNNAFIMDVIASTGGNASVNPNAYTYGTQRIYALGGREYVRQLTSDGNGSITYGDWITMYSTLDKPTATEIGAANTAFSNIPDIPAALSNIKVASIFKGTVDGVKYTFNTALTQAEYSVAGTNLEGAPYTGTCYGKLVVIVNNGTTHNNSSNWIWQVFYSTTFGRVYLRTKVNEGAWSSWGVFYNENNKPTPTEIGALPTIGGGTVAADNIRPIVVKNTADNACYTRFDGVDGILGFIGFAKEGHLRALTSDGSVLGDVYHTGNKPTPADIGIKSETWTFTLEDGSTVTKAVYVG